MAILTVSFDMYKDSSVLQQHLIYIGCGILFLICGCWLSDYIKDEALGNFFLLMGGISFVVLLVMGLSSGNPKDRTYKQEYETLEKSLLLNKVSEAKVNVKQLSDHKFVIKQDGLKHITSTVSGKKVTTTPNTTTGKAYLRVVDYIKDQQKKEPTIKIKITPSLSNTTASYETPRGKFRIICYADNQSQHKSKNSTKIIKY